MSERIRDVSGRSRRVGAKPKSQIVIRLRKDMQPCPHCGGKHFRERQVRRKILLITCLVCGKTWIKADESNRTG